MVWEPWTGCYKISDGCTYCYYYIEYVSACGESGREARVCDYNWILNIREQCKNAGVPFEFRSTGSLFRKDDEV